jgi:Ribbon-helix-helix protein, copG family
VSGPTRTHANGLTQTHGNVVPNRVRLSAKLPPDLIARLDVRARRDGQTRTALIEEACEAALRERPPGADLDARCRRVGDLLRGALLPHGPATPAAFVSLTLEAWLRQHAGDLGAAALDDLASALDAEGALTDPRGEP